LANKSTKKFKIKKEKKIFFISLAVSLIFFVINFINLMITGNWNEFRGVLGPVIMLSAFIITVPQMLLTYEKYRVVKEYEEKFPLFLRDLIESLRSGMPFHKAVIVASRLEYGKFSVEVKKMANQISWGMPFEKVINQLTERVNASKRMVMALKIIRETYLTGGDVITTLEAVADSTITLEEAEKEKKSLLNEYVVLMYAIAFLFVGIVVAINNVMVPIFQTSEMISSGGGQAFGISNPCGSTSNAGEELVCSLFASVSRYVLFIIPDTAQFYSSIGAYYVSLFFCMSIIEAMCCGLVAGQISEGSVPAGIKHSFIMLCITFGAYYILIFLKVLGV
jgi:flagellar protein FlaJ